MKRNEVKGKLDRGTFRLLRDVDDVVVVVVVVAADVDGLGS